MPKMCSMSTHKNALHWLAQPFDDMCGNDCTEYIKHPVTALTGSACHKRQHGLAGSACHINIYINTPDEEQTHRKQNSQAGRDPDKAVVGINTNINKDIHCGGVKALESIHIYMYICIYIHMHRYRYIYIYIYIYI